MKKEDRSLYNEIKFLMHQWRSFDASSATRLPPLIPNDLVKKLSKFLMTNDPWYNMQTLYDLNKIDVQIRQLHAFHRYSLQPLRNGDEAVRARRKKVCIQSINEIMSLQEKLLEKVEFARLRAEHKEIGKTYAEMGKALTLFEKKHKIRTNNLSSTTLHP